jgi:O-acetyl-ADP-ribose deacetylase (regulator of RNase III)
MPIEYVTGDLFINRFRAEAFAQGCNCQGSMGAGIAVGFRERYTAMYEEYCRRCKAKPREFNVGDVFFWPEDGRPAVFNLGTQEDYWRSRATYLGIEQCLLAMLTLADADGVRSIAMPRIGAGYGGLSWKKVRAVIDRVFADWPGTLIVYNEYQPEG